MEDLSRRRSAVSLVLDSSATLAWIFGDETTEPIRRLFEAVAEQGAFVPSIWRLEVANSLTVALRRRRIDDEFRRSSLADLDKLDIIVDGLTDARAWSGTLDLADRFRLTVYDSAYLELSLRRDMPLATLDQDMRSAATILGLKLLGAD